MSRCDTRIFCFGVRIAKRRTVQQVAMIFLSFFVCWNRLVLNSLSFYSTISIFYLFSFLQLAHLYIWRLMYLEFNCSWFFVGRRQKSLSLSLSLVLCCGSLFLWRWCGSYCICLHPFSCEIYWLYIMTTRYKSSCKMHLYIGLAYCSVLYSLFFFPLSC